LKGQLSRPHGNSRTKEKIAQVRYDGKVVTTALYARLGGEGAVQAAVVRLYEKIMSDKTLAPFFEGLDLDAQIQKQIAFLTMVFGGPSTYSGPDLRAAHAASVRSGLNGDHFDSVARHLAETALAMLRRMSITPR
jgi:hemoglobin